MFAQKGRNKLSMRDFSTQTWPVFACALLAVVFVCLSSWTTQDGPNHQKVALILSRLSESPLENKIYKNNLSLLQTNELFPALYSGLSKKMSPETYEKVFVAFFMAALIVAYWIFLKTWSRQSLCYWPLILPLCFNPLILRGFYNFLACLPLTLICLVLLKKGQESRKFHFWISFGFFAWLAFLAHPFSSFILIPVITLMLLAEIPVSKERAVTLLPFLILSFIFFGLGFLPDLLHSAQHEQSLSLKFSPPWETLLGLFAWNVSGFHWLSFVIFLPFFLVLIRLATLSLKEVSWENKKYWIAFLVLLFIFPLEASQGSFLNHRFLIFIWIFLPLGLKASNFSGRRFFFLCLATYLAFMLMTAFAMQKNQRVLQDAKKVLTLLPEQSRLYPINFDTTNSSLSMHPLIHLWAVYPASKVVLSPYLFAYSNLMPLSRQLPSTETYFPATNESLAQEMMIGKLYEKQEAVALQEILQAAAFYDYWLLHKAPESFLNNLNGNASLEKIAESNEISLWHYKNSKSFNPNPFESL